MKILHLLQSNRFSGAENVVCQIISILSDTNIDFIYCSRDGQIRESLYERKIKFSPIDKLSVSEVKRVINKEKPDIIHAHDMRASFYASLVCGNIPIISHIHNNNFDSRGLSLKSILYCYAAKKAKHIFWVSKSSFTGYIFHNFFKDKSTILYNIIDIDSLYKKMQLDNNSYNYDVVYLGRLTYPKNPQRVIDVLGKVIRVKNNLKVAIIGTGDLSDEIVQMIKYKKLETNIDYLGFQTNPYKILHDSKVMIMTSRWEGTPMCALEAMSLGVPIVSTPTDGLNELVLDGDTGYLSSDDDALANKICNILNNEQLRKKLSLNSSRKAKELMNIDDYKRKILRIYDYYFIHDKN